MVFPEQPRHQLGEKQDAEDEAQRQGDDHAEVKLLNAAGHGLDRGRGRSGSWRLIPGTTTPRPTIAPLSSQLKKDGSEGGVLDGLHPTHQEEGADRHHAQQDPMPSLAALPACGPEQRGEGAGDEANEQPGELRGVVGEGEVDHG